MEFKLHTQFSPELGKEWDHLLSQSIMDVPFLKYDHLRIWWETRGGGEWPLADELALVSAREGPDLVGLAPLFLHKQENKRSLYLLGSREICDYLDLIVQPEKTGAFLEELAGFMASPAFPNWDMLVLHNLLQSSPTINPLEKAARKMGWSFSTECKKRSPYIQLPGNWEDYLSSIDKKQRHEIRRKMRRAEKKSDLHWFFVDGEKQIEGAIDDFLHLMSFDVEKAAFLTTCMREHMRRVLRWAFHEKILKLAFLEIQGQKAASYFCFHYQNRMLVYNSGFDPKFGEYSPGWVLLGDLLKWSNENHIVEFDFMRGNEEYKYRFGATDRFVVCAIIDRARI
jgi:CelD/BcsL family acetyltransferase involved in cellulose biosynthesis